MLQALKLQEESLIKGLREGDDMALEFLYKAHYPMVLNFIKKNNGTEDDARDIYQDTVIILYEKLQNENFTITCQLKTFIYSVSRRIWLKKLSEKQNFRSMPDDQETFLTMEEETADFAESSQQFEIMAGALEMLGEPCRTLIEDFYLRSLSMDEIAEKFGYTNGDNAKNQKYKCLKRLKTLFFKNYR